MRLPLFVSLLALLGLASCNTSPRVQIPSVAERRMELLEPLLKKGGYHFSAAAIASMPDGVAVPFENSERPEESGTVEFRHIVFPKGKYRSFRNNGDLRNPGFQTSHFPESPVYPRSPGPVITEACTCVVTFAPAPRWGDPNGKLCRKIICEVHLCGLEQKGVWPVAYLDEMHTSQSGYWIEVPPGAVRRSGKFPSGALPIVNLTWMEAGKPVGWIYNWLEPAEASDNAPAFPRVKPQRP